MRQGPHQVAQKSTRTTLPRSALRDAGALPSRSGPASPAAAEADGDAGAASGDASSGAKRPWCSRRRSSLSDGRAWSFTETETTSLPRRTRRTTVEPGGFDETTRVTQEGSTHVIPETSTIRSPSRRPPSSAGEPRMTWAMRTPPDPSSTLSSATPSHPGAACDARARSATSGAASAIDPSARHKSPTAIRPLRPSQLIVEGE